MLFSHWFESTYKCMICYDKFKESNKHNHGKGICKDNRRNFGYRIIQKSLGYEVQGNYMFSLGGLYHPEYYWDIIKEFKTIKEAREFKKSLELIKGIEVN